MQLIKPASYYEAIDKIASRLPIGSQMLSAEWSDVPAALRQRAMFSAGVENIRFLQRAKDTLTEFLDGAKEVTPEGMALKAGSRADFIEQLREFAIAEGMGPLDPTDAGSIKDITSERRLGLIFDVQTRQAHDYGFWRQGMDGDVLNEFPAQRFIRVQEVKEPRTSHAQYENQVFLKTDPIWAKVINADFGVPWGPWGWGCGHDVEDVDRNEAEDLGLIEPGVQLEPERKSFNENLEASTYGLEPELIDILKKNLGEQLIIDERSGTMRWKGES